jgi:hypothetical protein
LGVDGNAASAIRFCFAEKEFLVGGPGHFCPAGGISGGRILHLTTLERARAVLRSLDTAIRWMFK